jgi:transcriptional regulator with XRE-family HTH domain
VKDVLLRELERRRSANRRYSVRAFAASLRVDHATLSQILRDKRRLTPRMIRMLCIRLKLDAAHIEQLCADSVDDTLLRAIGSGSFRADSRHLATISNLPLDEVNVALQRLLYNRRVVMATAEEWRIA